MMQSNFENNSTMLKSAEPLLGSADSLSGNQYSSTLEQLNYKAKQHKDQNKSRKKIEEKEHQKADVDLENDIQNFDENIVTDKNLNNFIELNYDRKNEVLILARKYLSRQSAIGRGLSMEELKKHLNKEYKSENNI